MIFSQCELFFSSNISSVNWIFRHAFYRGFTVLRHTLHTHLNAEQFLCVTRREMSMWNIFPINMPLCASTGPVLGRCWQHWPSTGSVLAHNSMFMRSVMKCSAFVPRQLVAYYGSVHEYCIWFSFILLRGILAEVKEAHIPVNMPLVASTGHVLDRCWQWFERVSIRFSHKGSHRYVSWTAYL